MIDALEKVGVPNPTAVEECGLIDKVRSAAHRRERGLLGVPQIIERPGRALDADDAFALRL